MSMQPRDNIGDSHHSNKRRAVMVGGVCRLACELDSASSDPVSEWNARSRLSLADARAISAISAPENSPGRCGRGHRRVRTRLVEALRQDSCKSSVCSVSAHQSSVSNASGSRWPPTQPRELAWGVGGTASGPEPSLVERASQTPTRGCRVTRSIGTE